MGMLSIGDVLFDPASRRILRGREEVKLSPKSTAVLAALAESPGRVWSRDDLLERVWSPVHVGEEVLTHAIAELRRAFGDDFRAPKYLLTVHKCGYRLVAPVRRAERDEPLRFTGAPRPETSLTLSDYAAYISASELCERGGRQNLEAAISLFGDLTRAHSGFAPAHAGLARALIFLATYYRPGDELIAATLENCATAHRIASGSSEAFATEAFTFAMRGERAKSAAGFQQSLNLRPHDPETYYLLGLSSVIEANFPSAALIFEHAATLRGGDFRTLLIAGKLRLALAQPEHARRDFAMALPSLEARLLVDPQDVRALRGKARCLWHVGKADEAYDLMVLASKQADPMNYQLACTLACAGQTDRAIDVLEEAVDLGWRHKAWLERDPDVDVLRDHRRYQRVVASMQ